MGSQPSRSRVRVLEAGVSIAAKCPIQPSRSLASPGCDRDGRDAEVPPDRSRDLEHRDALLGDAVQRRAGRRRPQREPEEARRVEPVDGGPAIGPAADVGRDAVGAGDVDQLRDEAVVALTVDRRGKPEQRSAHAALRERERGLVGGDAVDPPEPGRGESSSVLDLAGLEQRDPRGDDEGFAGAGERLADGLDRAQVRAIAAGQVAEVVDERGEDDAVGLGRALAQSVEIVERAVVDVRSGARERRGDAVRTGEPEHVMARLEQVTDDGRADESGCPGEKTRMPTETVPGTAG